MSTATISEVVGRGAPTLSLSAEELRVIVAAALDGIDMGERVLAIVPDKTRDDNTDLLFPFASEILSQKKIKLLDALIAQGTHAPMTEAEEREKIGWSKIAEGGIGRIFDHQWNRDDELVTLGELSADRIADLTDG